jgi:hypothetical protein
VRARSPRNSGARAAHAVDEEIRWKDDNAALYRQLAVRSARSMREVDALEEIEPGRRRIEIPAQSRSPN